MYLKTMANNAPEIIVGIILITTTGILFIINKSAATSYLFENISPEFNWIVHGILNILGYSTIFLPGYLVYKYIYKINYLDKPNNGFIAKIIRKCFLEDESINCTQVSSTTTVQRTTLEETFILLSCFIGLLVSYLSWGLLQEKVMTQKYTNKDGEISYFKDSQFLVFVNRILAFCMSGIVILCKRQPRHKCPLYKYIYCSFSNIMSSWCQYEALKYVSFPHQVLAKAAKTIPVMIMGKIISKAKYEYYEYVTAVILSVGMLMFMLDTGNDRSDSTVTTFSGVILLCSYIAFDSFTSNWQGSLFKQYGMSTFQMMCAVNFFSCIFTAVSLLQQGGFITSLHFMFKFPKFLQDCIFLSICSASGQLFIFYTLSTFGPLVFAIITTIRQGFSVLLSCITFNHRVNFTGMFGLILVFFSILLRIYCGHRIKSLRKRNQTNALKI